jgi:hypothetical protein
MANNQRKVSSIDVLPVNAAITDAELNGDFLIIA